MPKSKTTKRGREARADAAKRSRRARTRVEVAASLTELADLLAQMTPEERAEHTAWIEAGQPSEEDWLH